MSGGVAAALSDVLEGRTEAERLVQEGLFDDLDVTETGDLDARSPLSGAHPLAGALAERKRGRPQGSKNRRTEATVRWLLSQHRHPLSVMAEAYSMSPAELAARVGISSPDDATLLDLFKLQVRMAEALAPYVAQRLPQAVELTGGADFTLSFAGVSLPARGGLAGNPEGGEAIEGQCLAVTLPAKSDGSSRTDGES